MAKLRPLRQLRTSKRVETPQQVNRKRIAQLAKLPPIRIRYTPPPDAASYRYARQLLAVVDGAWRIIAATVLPVVESLAREQRRDAEDPPLELDPTPDPAKYTPAEIAEFKRKAAAGKRERTAARALTQIPLPLVAALNTLDRELTVYANSLPANVHPDIVREIERQAVKVNVRMLQTLGVKPIDAGTAMDKARVGWLKDNADLIVSQPKEMAERVRSLVETMVPKGARWETISKRLQDEHGIGKRRANLIARDQVQKYNADLTRLQQQAAGFGFYTWRGTLDNRERPAHVALEGTVWSWDNPPMIGNPGEPIQCRCVAIPLASDREIAKAGTMTEAELIDRTAALGPTQRQAPSLVGKTEAQKEALIRKRAASEVSSEIRLAKRRAAQRTAP